MSFPVRFLIGIFAIAVLACLFISLWPQPQPPAAKSETPTRKAVLLEPQEAPSPRTTVLPQASLSPTPGDANDPTLRPPPFPLDTSPLSWELQLARVNFSQKDPASKARAILALLPHLPEEALATATEEAVKDLPDASYAGVALPVVTNPNTHGQAMSVLFADLMERPDPIALPALLSIARNSAHPFAASALDNLKLVLRENHGNDWPKWQAAIERRLTPQTR